MRKALFKTKRARQAVARGKSRRAIEKSLFIDARALALRMYPPQSEQWFQALYEQHRVPSDQYNVRVLDFIPDVVNFCYRYTVEVDGSVHRLPEVAAKDKLRASKFRKLGFEVIRVRAFVYKDFEKAARRIVKIRSSPKPRGAWRPPAEVLEEQKDAEKAERREKLRRELEPPVSREEFFRRKAARTLYESATPQVKAARKIMEERQRESRRAELRQKKEPRRSRGP